jgi:hypothetical protein
VIRIFVALLGWLPPAADRDHDALGEILRSTRHGGVAPEVLLRIL